MRRRGGKILVIFAVHRRSCKATMKIIYQGAETSTDAANVAAFLAERGVDAASVVVEFQGCVLAGDAALSAATLAEGAALNVFRICAGG